MADADHSLYVQKNLSCIIRYSIFVLNVNNGRIIPLGEKYGRIIRGHLTYFEKYGVWLTFRSI